MGGDSTLGGRWYRSGGRPGGLAAAARSPMRGDEGGLKWIEVDCAAGPGLRPTPPGPVPHGGPGDV